MMENTVYIYPKQSLQLAWKKKKIQGTLTKKPLGYFFISVWQNEPEQWSRFGRIIWGAVTFSDEN